MRQYPSFYCWVEADHGHNFMNVLYTVDIASSTPKVCEMIVNHLIKLVFKIGEFPCMF